MDSLHRDRIIESLETLLSVLIGSSAVLFNF